MDFEKKSETEKHAEAVRREQVRQLWKIRPREQRTAMEAVNFAGWLADHNPNLIPPGQGDYYKRVKGDIADLIEPNKPTSKE